MTIAIFAQDKVKSELIKFAFPNLNFVIVSTHFWQQVATNPHETRFRLESWRTHTDQIVDGIEGDIIQDKYAVCW